MSSKTAPKTEKQDVSRGVEITVGESVIDRVKSIYDDVAQRAYQLFEDRGRTDGHAWGDWLSAEEELLQPLSLQVTQDENEIRVLAQVPGFKRGELKVGIDGHYLVISGEREQHEHRKTDGGTLTRQSCGCFFRAVELPAEVDSDKAKATLKDSFLEMSLPKLAAQTG